mmetsp:Transcript_8076/g.26844  ORF Transcript_8076/g.26844 Transcript_8076/m.26844 type:complete len:210 (-) Transcript_8076:877-1506(-)
MAMRFHCGPWSFCRKAARQYFFMSKAELDLIAEIDVIWNEINVNRVSDENSAPPTMCMSCCIAESMDMAEGKTFLHAMHAVIDKRKRGRGNLMSIASNNGIDVSGIMPMLGGVGKALAGGGGEKGRPASQQDQQQWAGMQDDLLEAMELGIRKLCRPNYTDADPHAEPFVAPTHEEFREVMLEAITERVRAMFADLTVQIKKEDDKADI